MSRVMPCRMPRGLVTYQERHEATRPRPTLEFYSKEADGTEEDEDVAEHSPWLYERSLRKDCCDAVAEGQALFAIATTVKHVF